MWSALDAYYSDVGSAAGANQNMFDRFIKWTRDVDTREPDANTWRRFGSVTDMRRLTGETGGDIA